VQSPSPPTKSRPGVTLWEREDAQRRSDEKARTIPLEKATGGTMRSVEQYEVLFFDVRTP